MEEVQFLHAIIIMARKIKSLNEQVRALEAARTIINERVATLEATKTTDPTVSKDLNELLTVLNGEEFKG